MATKLTKRFPVHGYEVDAFQTLSLPTLAAYLQEIAAAHADELGCGLDALRTRGLTWVLIRQRIKVPSPIRLGEELEIATWPSGIERLLVSREFAVTRAGVEVARSSTAWLLIDLETRRPVRPADVLDPELRPRLEALAPVPERLPDPDSSAMEERTFDVRLQDIDVNLHVNNTTYLVWALECASAQRWTSQRPSAVEVHYLAEGRLGERIVARSSAGGAAGDEIRHAIVREADGKGLARLRTRWVRREAADTHP